MWLTHLLPGQISVSRRQRGRTDWRRSSHRRRGTRPWLEVLEGRVVLSPTTYLVTDTSDSASDTGSLRYAISQANANPNTDGSLINFDSSVFGTAQTIKLSSKLELSESAGPEMIQGPGANP